MEVIPVVQASKYPEKKKSMKIKYVTYLVMCMAVFFRLHFNQENYLSTGCYPIETAGDRTEI